MPSGASIAQSNSKWDISATTAQQEQGQLRAQTSEGKGLRHLSKQFKSGKKFATSEGNSEMVQGDDDYQLPPQDQLQELGLELVSPTPSS